MYEMGRAVLVGVHQSISTHRVDCHNLGRAANVPYFIDWILDSIKNNTFV